ncbi:MAG: phage antirepressor protein [Pseudomonadaceae bacterium]|nr:phage antirepressor protein [Pseudomonadaceae bacterium]HCP54572.1 phage antirepressor protein [Pseudomonas sp.]|tara:strand:- start:638 stop:1372 length:735 start_codon:yes stop_codon:yes gene_type:complete
MHTQSHQDNTGLAAPHFMKSENVARTMSSREIAKVVGSRHSDVVRTIDRLIEKKVVSGCAPSAYTHEQNGQTYHEYLVSKRDSFVVVAQLCPEFTAALVDRWQELESRNTVTLPDFSNPALAARAWAEQFELNQAANQALAIAAPKVDFVDRYVESTGLKGFRQTAKLLGANESRFREFLLDEKILYRLGGEWQAYQKHIDAGRFSVKTGSSESGHAYNQVKFTPKGVSWVAGLWAQHNLEGEF